MFLNKYKRSLRKFNNKSNTEKYRRLLISASAELSYCGICEFTNHLKIHVAFLPLSQFVLAHVLVLANQMVFLVFRAQCPCLGKALKTCDHFAAKLCFSWTLGLIFLIIQNICVDLSQIYYVENHNLFFVR